MGIAELTYDIIWAAGHGDKKAQEKVLEYYDSYINALSTIEVNVGGVSYKYVDEDIKAEIQLQYLQAIPKCKVI